MSENNRQEFIRDNYMHLQTMLEKNEGWITYRRQQDKIDAHNTTNAKMPENEKEKLPENPPNDPKTYENVRQNKTSQKQTSEETTVQDIALLAKESKKLENPRNKKQEISCEKNKNYLQQTVNGIQTSSERREETRQPANTKKHGEKREKTATTTTKTKTSKKF